MEKIGNPDGFLDSAGREGEGEEDEEGEEEDGGVGEGEGEGEGEEEEEEEEEEEDGEDMEDMEEEDREEEEEQGEDWDIEEAAEAREDQQQTEDREGCQEEEYEGEEEQGEELVGHRNGVQHLQPFELRPEMQARHGPYEPVVEAPCKGALLPGKRCIMGMMVPTAGFFKGHQCHSCRHFFHSPCTGEPSQNQ